MTRLLLVAAAVVAVLAAAGVGVGLKCGGVGAIAAGVVGCTGGRAVALHGDILGGERLL